MKSKAIAAILVATAGLGMGGVTAFANTSFSDVPTSNVHHGNIDRAAEESITAGCASDKFCPKDNVTRAAMASLLVNLLDVTRDDNDAQSDDIEELIEALDDAVQAELDAQVAANKALADRVSALEALVAEQGLDTDNDGIPNSTDTDDDGDDVNDEDDAFPTDSTESVDTDGDGVGNNADTDDDGDGVEDGDDAFPLDPDESVDTDKDGIGNNADTDDDGDSVLDAVDAFPLDPKESLDTDKDGVGDNADNCRLVANSDQADADPTTPEGDACESPVTVVVEPR